MKFFIEIIHVVLLAIFLVAILTLVVYLVKVENCMLGMAHSGATKTAILEVCK